MERLERAPPRSRPKTVTIIDACADPNLFGPHFRNKKTWAPWFSFLATLFGLPLTPDQLDTYRQHTGRTDPPTTPHREAWLVVGRRGGKSFVLALTAVYLATFHDWRRFLNVGERGTVMIVAADRKQARTIMRYITGLLRSVPMLRQLIENSTAERITLRNRIIIEIHTASYTSTRGYTIVAALLDELAFWPSDEQSAQPDVEVLNAIKPGMATIPDAMLLCASSPHARRGALWDSYHRHYGKDHDPVLVWRAATRKMNATVPQRP
jgi:phage terminase large subunit-like protein